MLSIRGGHRHGTSLQWEKNWAVQYLAAIIPLP